MAREEVYSGGYELHECGARQETAPTCHIPPESTTGTAVTYPVSQEVGVRSCWDLQPGQLVPL